MSTENSKANILLLPFCPFSLSNEPRENCALPYTAIRLWNWEFGDQVWFGFCCWLALGLWLYPLNSLGIRSPL